MWSKYLRPESVKKKNPILYSLLRIISIIWLETLRIRTTLHLRILDFTSATAIKIYPVSNKHVKMFLNTSIPVKQHEFFLLFESRNESHNDQITI